jgi:cation:H+ antiporter
VFIPRKRLVIMTYILLIVGFALPIKGADLFVEGASKIARALQVSPLLIGLTIIAFGTSSPEATVSIVAALEDNAGVAELANGKGLL